MSDSWFSRVWDAAVGATAEKGQAYTLKRLATPFVDAAQPREITKDEEYISITVLSSRIVNSRQWTGKFYGAIHARGSYLHEDRLNVEYQTVLSPKLMKELDPKHLERVIIVNQPVLGPVPYIGKLSLELGLFSVKGAELAGPYIEVLTSLADTAGIGSFSKALPLVAPLRKGLDLLFGNHDQAELEIGIDQTWTKSIETGIWLLLRVPKGTAGVEGLKLDKNDYGIVTPSGSAYDEQPYVVFEIEASDRRDDWVEIAELKNAWDAIGAAAKAGQQDDAETLFKQFILILQWSPDLVPKDKKRLEDKARSRLPQLQKSSAISLFPGDKDRPKPHPLGEFASLDLYGD